MDHLNEENIKYSEVYLKHKELLKRIFLFAFFFLNIMIILNLAYRFVSYNNGFLRQLETEKSLATTYIPFNEIRQKLSPNSLRVENITVISIAPGKYDVVARINNPNEKWMTNKATVVARIDGIVTNSHEIFVLPGNNQYAFWFGVESQASNPTVRVEILETEWKRVGSQEPMEVLREISFSPPQSKYLADGFTVESELINNSASSFWDFSVMAIATRQNEIVGINLTSLEKVKAGSNRSFSMTWPWIVSAPQEIKLIPYINVYNEENYMPFAQTGEPSDPSGVEY